MIDLEIASFVLLIFLGIVFGYIAGRYRKRAAENCGEARVRHSLAKYCQNKDAHVLSNITLRLEDSSTTQIDHILIISKGIFVIETKHYKGWIFAKAKSRFWSQSLWALIVQLINENLDYAYRLHQGCIFYLINLDL